jgi:shikimate kinase
MKIVLIGYMGSGKSTLGKEMATRLSIPFLDLDHLIEEEEGMSIPKIFETKGAIYFRKKESEVLHHLKDRNDSFVLSTGGGTPCYGNNIEVMKEITPNVVYIKLPVSALAKRLANTQGQRPIIADLSNEELVEFVGKHLFERLPFYEQASIVIDTQDKSVEESIAQLELLIQ